MWYEVPTHYHYYKHNQKVGLDKILLTAVDKKLCQARFFLCNLPRDLHSYILKWGTFCYNGICQYLSKLHFWVPNQSCGCTIIWNFVIRLFQNALCMKYIEKYEKGIIMHEDKNILSLTLTHQRGFSY